MAMAELARHLGLDRSSVTGLIDRAQKRGLVAREPRPEDGRGVQVRIAPDGAAMAERARVDVTARLLALAVALTATEKATMTTLTRKLLDLSSERSSP